MKQYMQKAFGGKLKASKAASKGFTAARKPWVKVSSNQKLIFFPFFFWFSLLFLCFFVFSLLCSSLSVFFSLLLSVRRCVSPRLSCLSLFLSLFGLPLFSRASCVSHFSRCCCCIRSTRRSHTPSRTMRKRGLMWRSTPRICWMHSDWKRQRRRKIRRNCKKK